VFAGHGAERFDAHQRHIAVLDSSQEKASDLHASFGNGLESLDRRLVESIDNVQVNGDPNRGARYFPYVIAGCRPCG
jgi:hypothetical protein